MSKLTKRKDGTYDLTGLTQDELDALTTSFGCGPCKFENTVDEQLFALYQKLRKGGAEYREAWVSYGE